MRRISITGPRQYAFAEVETPVAGPGELIVASLRVGICATDMELLDGTMVYLRNGMATWPFTPGHEWVGVVVDPGTASDRFTVGDLVVGECSIGCWDCPVCDSGNYHQCPDRRETGLFGQSGALSEFFSFPALSAHLVPVGVRLEDIALTEPAAVAYKGLQRLEFRSGHKILINGGGTLGYLAAAIAAKAFSAEVVYWAGRQSSRARLSALGARPVADGEKVDYIFDTASSERGFAEAFSHLAPRGRISSVSFTGQRTVGLPVDELVTNDWELFGSLGSPNIWPEVIELIAARIIEPSKLLTDTFTLAQYPQAIELVRRRLPQTAKVMIVPFQDADEALAAAADQFGCVPTNSAK
ncbi:MAG: alcohol dehydrogenase catalytic domain-containing protein [Propionibacteriaceae bacterium]|jgi:threonine dehydrogenase-like Zn-dependent dehydrogenase|nr:alcohol dehydrogenase catalytic domain-containing protein [Propionibacteriaceae bacterium]